VAELAAAEGFPMLRFAPAAPLLAARDVALARHADGDLAEMGWMTPEWLTRATDPGAFLAGARTVVLLALPYARPSAADPSDGVARGRVAQYAQGRDYHRVFEKKLRRIARQMREELGAAARPTVDYGPLLERPLAALSGMGWLGKSTMLLVPGMGPWMLLGAIATDLELTADEPLKKSCGSCRRCIVACPTGAISPEGSVLDARLCISYHTIENRGPIPRELRPKFGDWVFGCDDCLSSCPVGASGTAPAYPDFVPTSKDHARPPLVDLLALTEDAFRERFRGQAITRAKRDGLVRNACIAVGNVGGPGELPVLMAALTDTSALVRGHAAWAVGELVTRLRLDPAPALEALAARLAEEPDGFVSEELRECLTRIATPHPAG
jgi:epoxyqueuosine reductase